MKHRPRRALAALAAATVLSIAPEAHAQEFKIPITASPFVFRPGEDIATLENVRSWTIGLGVLVGLGSQRTSGLVAQATYGGPYWYWSVGAGRWNTGDRGTAERGFGVGYHYNVFQSRDHRSRLGVQFGWSTGSLRGGRVGVLSYRAIASHSPTRAVSLYGGLGGETRRQSVGGQSALSTGPAVLGGVQTRLGRFALSTGIESVLSDAAGLTVASSLRFDFDEP